MSKDPIEIKQEFSKQLDQDISNKNRLTVESTKKVNEARQKAEETIKRMLEAVRIASDAYMDFINVLESEKSKLS